MKLYIAKVAIAKFKFWEFYILPPDQTSNFTNIRVAYKMEKTRNASNGRGHGESGDCLFY